jgi:PKD repeat protein
MNYKKIFLPIIAALMIIGLTDSAIAQSPCDTILPDFSSNAPRCTGGAVDFVYTQQAYDSLTYLWDFGSGANPAISVDPNPTGIVYSTPGLKLVTLTVEIDIGATTCIKIKTAGVSIVETPDPDMSFLDDQCEEAEFNFNYNGSTGIGWTYSWDFGGGANPAVSSAQNPSGVKYIGSGAKTVTLNVSNGSCVGSKDTVINVLNKPDAGFSVVSPACTGDAVSFTNTGTSGAGVSHDWDFGSGATPGSVTGVE